MRLEITYDHPVPLNAFAWTPRSQLQKPHAHASLEIGLCVSGAGWFYFGDKRYAVSPGDVFVVNNRELHIAQSDERDPSAYIFLNFDPNLLRDEDARLLLPFAYRPERFDNRIASGSGTAMRLAPLVRAVHEELSAGRPGYETLAKSLLLQIAVELLRHFSGLVAEPEWQAAVHAFARARDALAEVDRRFAEPLSLDDVAALLGVSPSRASRLFKEATGRSFKDYLLQLRLNEARRLLTSTTLGIADVCFESGFQSMATFYRAFRDASGSSPAEFRERHDASAIFENPDV